MTQLIEFAGNNIYLVIALVVIAGLIIKAEVGLRLSNINQLNVNDAVRLMNDDNLVILDVREDKEFNSGHIRDSVHIPLGALSQRINELEKFKNKNILAVCRSGSRSNSACSNLKKQGFENVNNLAGGIMSWSGANLPITQKK